MSEICPLRIDEGDRQVSDRGEFPLTCRQQCESKWENLDRLPEPAVSILDDTCHHTVEVGDEILRVDKGAERMYGVVYTCRRYPGSGHNEVLVETYRFACDHDDPEVT